MTSSKYLGALDNLMALEGGKTVDHAGATNYGITLRNLINSGDMDFDKDQDGDLDKRDLWAFTREDAKVYIWRHWYTKYSLDEILSPTIASKALDIIYNFGPTRGVKTVQKSCNSFGHGLRVDGKLGPRTLRAINSTDDAQLLSEMRKTQRRWYLHLINRRPEIYQKYERGWLRRAAT